MNNGGGRDTYISDSAGGLRAMYVPAQHKRNTFYTNLRVYPQSSGYKRVHSQTATHVERNDVFQRSQQHFNTKFNRETSMIHHYQNNLDSRLSRPKQVVKDENGRVTKNSVRMSDTEFA